MKDHMLGKDSIYTPRLSFSYGFAFCYVCAVNHLLCLSLLKDVHFHCISDQSKEYGQDLRS
jgi:hypothetical protein